jgi:hypothetical protein
MSVIDVERRNQSLLRCRLTSANTRAKDLKATRVTDIWRKGCM